jgi:alpha-tubulin suppressor-like RCC1 family protein
LKGVRQISLGGSHVCALMEADGSVRCWGRNDVGQVGDGTTTDQPLPRPVQADAAGTPLTGAYQLVLGGLYSCALFDGGAVRCWGSNAKGEMGNATLPSTPNRYPANVRQGADPLQGVGQMTAGFSHACASFADGTLGCWGSNELGELARGSATELPLLFDKVVGLKPWN